MRTLGEIWEAAQAGEMPTHQECYFAMLVHGHLQLMASRDLRNLAHEGTPVPLKVLAQMDFDRVKKSWSLPPDEYLGDAHTPGTNEHSARRQLAEGVARAVGLDAARPGGQERGGGG